MTDQTSGRLLGKTALITGAGAGLGRAIALIFAQQGAKVICTDINEESVRIVAQEIGPNALALHHDVTDEAQWTDVIAQSCAHFGGLDILVNNAGIGNMGSVENTSTEDWRQMHAVDLDSVFFGCRAAMAALKNSKSAAIVNISSVAGLIADGNLAAYCSAKAAVRHFSKSVALHCAHNKYPIRCNSVHPAFIDTAILDDVVPGMPRDILVEKLARQNPMKRLGDPNDVAYAVLYLASDEAKFVNGAELAIDGGLSAQ
ncbi:short-chain dehydrogenase [Iodidimonas muriae]|uniref:Short-chain dehydrogenase n=1 Tax=Iodidimonas muriae TaxID=261467 RepID=A0ABQ2LAB8_9PROT|nr:glucose 1-dehydrogenase [Iodidimonas muriae]GER06138.1 short-chain dehydrogenase [Kordiimonadales bacterium JCM 17843]GGO08391.1 short-chain dehydrogenase [Iodidimonas muriae]